MVPRNVRRRMFQHRMCVLLELKRVVIVLRNEAEILPRSGLNVLNLMPG